MLSPLAFGMDPGPTPRPEADATDPGPGASGDPFRVGQHAARARRVAVDFGSRARRLNPFERFLWAIVALIAFVFGLVLLIPFLILGLAFMLIVFAWVTVRRAIAQANTGGPADGGRKNVRVIRRHDP